MDGLLENIDRLHTTVLGAERICKNLRIQTEDVVSWCREKILREGAVVERAGKNWYILADCVRITVNAYSYTIITAHSRERDLGGKAGENFGVFGAKMGKNREI